MSATNFWNNFTNGFLNGMFNNNPFFGCFNGLGNFGGFGCNSFGLSMFNGWDTGFMGFGGSSPSLFLTPDFNMGSTYPLMPTMTPPSASFNFDMSSMFNNNIWENAQFSNNNLPMPSMSFNANNTFSDVFVSQPKKTSDTKYVDNADIGKWNTKYDNLIKKYSKEYNVDPKLVKALMKQESGFNPNVKSRAGAIGLMQLMPATAKQMGATNPADPEQNIKAGVKYLKQLLDKYKGNKELAIAAYNAGPGNVKNGRIPQNGETPKHVRAVMANYRALA